MRATVTDRQSFRVDSQRIILDNGYMSVPGRVARSGIQQYSAAELGLVDRPPDTLINVYRPPEEVFKAGSLASYDNADITVHHPDDFVDSSTFKDVSVGHATSTGRQSGEYVVVDMLIKAQDAIDAVNAGTAELSAGYSSEYLPQTGIAPDGTPYEFIQTDITINHIALCDSARAGRMARLFDSTPQENPPMPHITLDSGARVDVADQATATLIQTTLDSLVSRIRTRDEEKEDLEKKVASLDVELEKKDDELEEEKEKTSDAAIQARVDQVVDALTGASRIIGKKFACDSMNPMVIKRRALDEAGITCRKYDSWQKAPDVYVSAWFDAEEERKEEDEDPDDNDNKTHDSHRRFAKDMTNAMTRNTGDANQQRVNARQNFLDERYGKKAGDK
ncbi:DUF2213 domain-containing protein [Buttiauxella sp. B2]|uniref:DUF2213 domain-containing protein n=1 Tax=Buttiauxella sp. B2 TaxID=2587812 RepID=UPI00111CE632|nr:DUF2213 domain-containing protein [Buttiauxella sp. B2]TNV22838.1 DUF2213 domain-containing protein [Buttiauxella sp. B2]